MAHLPFQRRTRAQKCVLESFPEMLRCVICKTSAFKKQALMGFSLLTRQATLSWFQVACSLLLESKNYAGNLITTKQYTQNINRDAHIIYKSMISCLYCVWTCAGITMKAPGGANK